MAIKIGTFSFLIFALIGLYSMDASAGCAASANQKSCRMSYSWVGQSGEASQMELDALGLGCPNTRTACDLACRSQHALATSQRKKQGLVTQSENVECYWGNQSLFAFGLSNSQAVGSSNVSPHPLVQAPPVYSVNPLVQAPPVYSVNPVVQALNPPLACDENGNCIASPEFPSAANPPPPQASNSGLINRAQRLRGVDILKNLATMKANVKKNTKLNEKQKAEMIAKIEKLADITRSKASDSKMLTESERKHLFARINQLRAQIDRRSGGDGIEERLKSFELRISANLKNGLLNQKEAQELRQKIKAFKGTWKTTKVDGVSDEEEDMLYDSLSDISQMILLKSHKDISLDDLIKSKKKRINELKDSGYLTKKQTKTYMEKLNDIDRRIDQARKKAGKDGISRNERAEFIMEMSGVVSAAEAEHGNTLQNLKN